MKPYTVQGNLICVDFGFNEPEAIPLTPGALCASDGTVTLLHDDSIILLNGIEHIAGEIIDPPSDCAS